MRRNGRGVNGLALRPRCGTMQHEPVEIPPMRTLLVAVVFALSFSAPSHATLVIEGRAAQALHCAAMLFIVSTKLYDLGEISRNSRDNAQRAALVMLDKVPGTEDQQRRAMVQRFERIMTTRSPQQLAEEYTSTARWCMTNMLD